MAINPADSKIVDFTEANPITDSFEIKEKLAGKTGDDGKRLK